MTDPLQELARAADGAWLVGGAVRDRLLGRPTSDYDVAVAGEPRRVARALGRATDAHVFKLSDGFGAWRVVARDRSWQVDLLPVAGSSIEEDLGQRDLTVNAIAMRVGGEASPVDGEEYVDPYGGRADLRARRLRMVGPDAFARDPLRVLRLARLACELGFAVEPATASAAGVRAAGLGAIASERVFAELKRIVVSERVLDGLELMDSLGATAAVLPELTETRGVEQSHFHHLDVYGHTREVLARTVELVDEPERWFGESAQALARVLAEPLANELTRGQALRFGALFHDIAKPLTRRTTPEGRVTFTGHDAMGADMANEVLTRLRASQRLIEYVAELTRRHLRLGFLVHQMPLDRHAIYHYLRECEPVQVDVTVLSVADRLATRGGGVAETAIARHLELARQMLDEALAWRENRPRPPVRGHDLARAVGLPPGPRLGEILQELEEASFAGEIGSPAEALERARQLAAQPESSGR